MAERSEKISNARLHHFLLKFIIEHGFAPGMEKLADEFKAEEKEVTEALFALEVGSQAILLDFRLLCLELLPSKPAVTHSLADEVSRFQEYHGLKLHPGSCEIWAVQPFSLAPTNFIVKNKEGELRLFCRGKDNRLANETLTLPYRCADPGGVLFQAGAGGVAVRAARSGWRISSRRMSASSAASARTANLFKSRSGKFHRWLISILLSIASV